jgi:putative membrane protein
MNTSSISPKKIKQVRTLIIIASIAIPVVVAVLFKVQIPGADLSFLPPIYATINGITACLLVGALIAIKKNNRKMHELQIKICMVLSLLFLACYVAYHMASVSTVYGDLNHSGDLNTAEAAAVAGSLLIYRFILISHILLSMIIVPLVLFSYLFAWQGNFVRHRKWTRYTWPIWFYVAVTGVVVYLMISPYYA